LLNSEVLALNDGSPVRYQMNFEVEGTPIPIPGTFALLVSGLLGLLGIRKKLGSGAAGE
jgi:hypothetical protein